MKHATFFIVIAVVGYAAIQFMTPREFRGFRRAVTYHGLRLGALLLVVGLLLAVAVNFPASSIL